MTSRYDMLNADYSQDLNLAMKGSAAAAIVTENIRNSRDHVHQAIADLSARFAPGGKMRPGMSNRSFLGMMVTQEALSADRAPVAQSKQPLAAVVQLDSTRPVPKGRKPDGYNGPV